MAASAAQRLAQLAAGSADAGMPGQYVSFEGPTLADFYGDLDPEIEVVSAVI